MTAPPAGGRASDAVRRAVDLTVATLGLVLTAPVLALLFAVPALSLAGIPPFSGFLAKFGLVDAVVGRSC